MERFTFGKKLSSLGWQFLFMNGSGLRSDSLKRSCLRGLFSASILNQVLLQNGNVIKGFQGKGKKKKKTDSLLYGFKKAKHFLRNVKTNSASE